MTRTRGDQIEVRPVNDIYTALSAVACVTLIIALIALFTQSSAVFGDGLFFTTGNMPAAGR